MLNSVIAGMISGMTAASGNQLSPLPYLSPRWIVLVAKFVNLVVIVISADSVIDAFGNNYLPICHFGSSCC